MIRRLSFSVALLFVFGLAGGASAQETEVSGTVVKTHIKASSASLQIPTYLVPAVTPTSIHCHERCALRIRLDIQLSNLTPGAVVAAQVLVDGSTADIAPFAVAGIDSTSTTGASNSRTITWIWKPLSSERSAGRKHTVDVALYTTSGSAGSASRTVTVDVIHEGHGEKAD